MYLIFRIYYSVREVWGPFESRDDAIAYMNALIKKKSPRNDLFRKELMTIKKIDHHIDGVPSAHDPILKETA